MQHPRENNPFGLHDENSGLIVSNDISPKRIKALVKNVELMGITNTLVVNETPERLAHAFPEYFDRILLDVPCSGKVCSERTEKPYGVIRAIRAPNA